MSEVGVPMGPWNHGLRLLGAVFPASMRPRRADAFFVQIARNRCLEQNVEAE